MCKNADSNFPYLYYGMGHYGESKYYFCIIFPCCHDRDRLTGRRADRAIGLITIDTGCHVVS